MNRAPTLRVREGGKALIETRILLQGLDQSSSAYSYRSAVSPSTIVSPDDKGRASATREPLMKVPLEEPPSESRWRPSA